MKKLFVYYSLTGNGDLVADYLKNKGYDIRKVTEKKKMPKKFFFMVMTGGFRAGINAKAKLVNYDSDVSSYDEIVIGSPIWNAKFTPVLNSIVKQTNFENKKLTFVFYSGSGEGPKAEKKARELYPNAEIIFMQEPKKYDKEFAKLTNL